MEKITRCNTPLNSIFRRKIKLNTPFKIGLRALLIPLLLTSKLIIGQNFNADSLEKYLPENFSGQVAIKRNTHFIYKKEFGAKEMFSGSKVNDSTLFNIGQISHSMIHYFVQHLSGLGQIKPTDKITKYIFNFPYPNIQIRHLLNHQSGLPNSYVKLYHRKIHSNWEIKEKDKATKFDNIDILSLLENHKPPLAFEPGTQTKYSDLNYLVLVSLIEKVTFTPFRDFTHRMFEHHHFIFQPTLSAGVDTFANKAYGYRVLPTGQLALCDNLDSRGMPFADGTYGNQHIYMSAKNLTLWGQFILETIDIDYLKLHKDESVMGGFKYNTKFDLVVNEGFFGGTSSRLVFSPKSNLIMTINANAFDPNNNYKEFDSLLDYLSRLN